MRYVVFLLIVSAALLVAVSGLAEKPQQKNAPLALVANPTKVELAGNLDCVQLAIGSKAVKRGLHAGEGAAEKAAEVICGKLGLGEHDDSPVHSVPVGSGQ